MSWASSSLRFFFSFLFGYTFFKVSVPPSSETYVDASSLFHFELCRVSSVFHLAHMTSFSNVLLVWLLFICLLCFVLEATCSLTFLHF